MALTSTQVTNITKLAVAMFGVAPGGYMTTLTTIFNSVNGDMNAFANALAATPAFTSASYYPNYLTTAQIATKMVNSYGLTGDAATAAQDYFVANLNAGVSIGSLFVAANDFLAANASNATYSAAAATLANKAAVAEYYTVTLAGTSTDLGVLGGAISSVTATTDVSSTTAMAAVINSSSAAATGQTFTLTANVDSGSSFTGASGDDTFNGSKGTIDGDVLAGGAGNDTLNLTVDNADDNNAAFSATAIENLSVRTTATGVVSLDLGSVTGVEMFTANRLLNNLTLTDVQDIAAISIDRNASNANLTVTYAADVIAGTSDAVTITVTNSSDVGTVTVDGIETVNLVSTDNPTDDTNEIQIDAAGTGTATEVLNVSGAGDLTLVATDALTINNSASGDVDLTATAATTINHTGSGLLDVTVGAAVDATVSASTATGSLTVTANGAGDLDITGSAQADTFEFAATLTNDDTIVGGEGTDTLQILGDGVTSVADGDVTVTSVETLEIQSDTGADNLDFDVFSSPATFSTVVVTSTADADAVTLTDVQASTYTIRNATTSNTADDLSAVTIDLKDSTGTADAITVNLQNRQLGTTNNQEAFTLSTLTAAGVETINLNATKVSSEGTAEDITVTTVTAAALKTLNITGDADLTLGQLATTVTSVAAASYTGALDLTINTGAVNVATGSGDDTIRFGTTLGTSDTVNGGEGDDIVLATLSSGTVTPSLSAVETLGVTFSGGALNGSALGNVSTLRVVDATASAVVTGLTTTVATINQQGGNAGATALNLSYATGSNATVNYNITDATENVSNSGTSFANVQTLTIAGGDGTTTDRTLALGSLTGTALNTVTVTSGDDTGDTVNTGNITAAAMQTLTVTADEANITVGSVGAAALTTLSLTSTGAGDLALGAVTAGDKVKNVTITSTVDGSVTTDDITATDSDITSFTINLDGTYGTSSLDRVTADNITTLSITTGEDGTSLAIEDFLIDETIGSVSIDAGAGFDGLTNFIDTSATGTVGDITLRANGAMTIADAGGEVFINDAITVGNISLTATADGSITLGLIDEATTVGNITVVANGDVTWTGADAATTVGNISATVAENKTADLGTIGAGGTIGTITATGAGDFTLTVGAVTSMGSIDMSGLDGDSTITLDSATTIGAVFTGGDGVDTFTGTGGADVITAGLGADVIDGQGGADTIDLTEGTASMDTVDFQNDGVAMDTVTGFKTTSDKLSFDGLTGITATTGTAIAANAAATTVTDGAVYVFANGADGTGAESIADYTDLADVSALIAAAFSDEAANDEFVAVINDLVADVTYVYYVDFDNGNGGVGAIDTDALVLIGKVTEVAGAALVAGDIA